MTQLVKKNKSEIRMRILKPTTMKFGGTSVQDAPAIRRLIEIVATRPGPRIVVVSALSKVTDQLVLIAEKIDQGLVSEALKLAANLEERHLLLSRELELPVELMGKIHAQFAQLNQLLQSLESIGELTPRSRDRILAVGELCSSILIAEAFRAQGVKAVWLDSREVLRTNAEFTTAQPDFIATERACQQKIPSLFIENEVVVAPGFIGGTEIKSQQVTTTLGRGGSDYSAALLGAAMDSEKIEIWTDVDGILTTDPRMIPEAKRILKLSFDEAAELAYFGAKVLHPATIFPAVKKRIPVFVLNSKNPQCSGTEITHEAISDDNVIKAIATKRNISLINIHSTRMLGAAGFLKSVFGTFAQHEVSIDLISTSEVNVSLTLDPKTDRQALEKVISELEAFSKVTVQHEMASIATVGKGIRQAAGVGARIFSALKGVSVAMISMGSSEVNLSLVVQDAQVKEVIQKLHDEFFIKDLNPALFQ